MTEAAAAVPPPAPARAPLGVAELRPAVAPAVAPESVDRKVRNVTPLGVTPGPPVTGGLVRIAPPPRPQEPEPAPAARSERLFRPVVAAAGLVVSGEREVRLAGVEAPGPEATCGEGASAWPCGRMARAALRRFVRGRAIECEVPAGAAEIPDPARCKVAGRDLSEWLVTQGWAKRSGESFAEAETAARQAERGVWAALRPGAQADALAARGAASAPESALSINSLVSGRP